MAHDRGLRVGFIGRRRSGPGENGGGRVPEPQKRRAQIVDREIVMFPICHAGGEMGGLIKRRRVSSRRINQEQCVRRQKRCAGDDRQILPFDPNSGPHLLVLLVRSGKFLASISLVMRIVGLTRISRICSSLDSEVLVRQPLEERNLGKARHARPRD